MNKVLSLVALMASVSFGSVVEIDLSIPEQGWDHKNASLVSINLAKYLNGNTDIESAVLKFTGVQNLREPENNDILNISLLKLKGMSGDDLQKLTIFKDGEDNQQSPSNYFEVTSNNFTPYTWVAGESNIASYSDNNDVGSWVKHAYLPSGTKDYTNESGESFYYIGQIGNTNWHDWGHLENYTTQDFDRVLNVATVKNFMDESNGWLGVGADADCHYMGNVKLVVTTRDIPNVPEPTSLSLMLLGLTSLGGALFIRKRK
ncbi:MAG TPA: PEP-CTERM sorting domain-containing protein [Chitinispirillaceae bacterium]|nr:PEP-CTERM sorting domain-containing protein [Chitinispirillaceae bacterium]